MKIPSHAIASPPQKPAPEPPKPTPPQPDDSYTPSGFVGGVDDAANGLLKVEGALVGAGAALRVAGKALQLVSGKPVTITGPGAGFAAVGVLLAAGAVAYGGGKAGHWVAGKATQMLDQVSDSVAKSSGSQAAGNAVRVLPKLAVGMGVASLGHFAVNDFSVNLAVPAAGWLAVGGVSGAIVDKS